MLLRNSMPVRVPAISLTAKNLSLVLEVKAELFEDPHKIRMLVNQGTIASSITD